MGLQGSAQEYCNFWEVREVGKNILQLYWLMAPINERNKWIMLNKSNWMKMQQHIYCISWISEDTRRNGLTCMQQLDLLQLFVLKEILIELKKVFDVTKWHWSHYLWHLRRETAYKSSRYCYFIFFRFCWIVGLLIASAKIPDRKGNISPYSFYGQLLDY